VPFIVVVDDGLQYQTQTGCKELGPYASMEQAIALAKSIVDDRLNSLHTPGMQPSELVSAYAALSLDLHVLTSEHASTNAFLAWPYVRSRSNEMCKSSRPTAR
jgi:hypothetical protein